MHGGSHLIHQARDPRINVTADTTNAGSMRKLAEITTVIRSDSAPREGVKRAHRKTGKYGGGEHNGARLNDGHGRGV